MMFVVGLLFGNPLPDEGTAHLGLFQHLDVFMIQIRIARRDNVDDERFECREPAFCAMFGDYSI